MFHHSSQEHQLPQTLIWGALHQERLSPADTMFTTTGRRIYVIGDIDGQFRPRSNPYDLYAFGKPNPDDPLAEKLQGVWAQPVKGINRYGYVIEWDGQRWPLTDAVRFTQSFANVQFDFQHGPIQAVRLDYAAADLPLLFSRLTLRNAGPQALALTVTFQCQFALEDAWFTHLADKRNVGETVSVETDRLVARSAVLPEQWAAAVGGAQPPDAVRLLADSTGELVYTLQLAPEEEKSLTFGMVIDSQQGAPGALRILERGLEQDRAIFAGRRSFYEQLAESGPHFTSPDAKLNAAFDLARANLHLLEAEAPGLGRYFYAGLEMFPFWFSNDGAYSATGMFASGLRDAALNHIRIGLDHLEENGRVPHQISPAGQVAFSGNAQETPLWVLSIWDAYRWTGDRDFLAEMYSGALKGMFDYVLGTIDPDGDGYPSGPGMVEVEGMGPEKLDSTAYTWKALLALAHMAESLGDTPNAQRARAQAGRIAAYFDPDWWDAQGGTYAMSLTDPQNARYPVPHWAVIVPLEVGLATPEHAAQTFATLRAQYLNHWGLKHTAGEDERVWTLPTATLSRSAYQYGEPGLGFEMLCHIAETLEQGSIGLFHEIIPEGACFVQLWSAATFLRGVIEDLLGIQVHAAEHHLRIAPQLPFDWDQAGLKDLTFGAHRIHVHLTGDSITIEHREGPTPLSVECVLPSGKVQTITIEPGETKIAV